jgi:transcriptional regulator with XRE-family HTH domain
MCVRHGWSLRQTAERSGMSPSLLSKIERGERTGYNVVYL